MKDIISGFFSVITILLIVIILYTVYGKTTRYIEISQSTTNALNIAMESLSKEDDLQPKSNNELKAIFMEAFSTGINAPFEELKVEFTDINYEKGLIRVAVTEKFKYINGNIGTVQVVETVIKEKWRNENYRQNYTINFINEGELYKKYSIVEGSNYIVPMNPTSSDSTLEFLGWKDLEDDVVYKDMIVFGTLIVEKDKTYVAEYKER